MVRRRWWRAAVVVAVLALAAALVIRIDEINADGWPVWRWAWQKKAEEKSLRVVVTGTDEFGNPVVAKVLSTPSEDAERRRREQEAERKRESAVDDFHNARGGSGRAEVQSAAWD